MRDVRMRGFAERADVEEVEGFLAAQNSALDAEPVPLVDCVGRVLVETICAEDVIPSQPMAGFPHTSLVIRPYERGQPTKVGEFDDRIPLEPGEERIEAARNPGPCN